MLRLHASLALGVVSRCSGRGRSTGKRDTLRERLDALGPEAAADRAAALAAATGSRSVLQADHVQRLWREALFVLVYALRPPSRDALLVRLGAS